MKYNPWRLAVALIIFMCLLVWSGFSRADDKNTHYCIESENGSKTVTQCQNGTVTIVDNFNDKVVVCSTNPSEAPRCQTLAFKDKK